MELTEQNFNDRLDEIIKCKKEAGDNWENLARRLKEKGVEYCIVLPVFEVLLGFDPLNDLKMEFGSKIRSDQRFDFVISPLKNDHYSLIVEAKSLSETNLEKHEEQIIKYMSENQAYPWGILTNGINWVFYLSKKYIELKFNEGRQLDHHKKKKVFKILSLSLEDDKENFISVMKSMDKDKWEEFWENVAKYTYSVITAGRGKKPTIVPIKQTHEFISQQIKNSVEIKTGEYWDSIQKGMIKPGDKIVCKNDFVDLTFELDSGGRLILFPEKVNTTDLRAFTKNCPKGLDHLVAWQGSTTPFTDRSQVVLMLTDRKKFTKNLQDQFPFVPSPEL